MKKKIGQLLGITLIILAIVWGCVSYTDDDSAPKAAPTPEQEILAPDCPHKPYPTVEDVESEDWNLDDWDWDAILTCMIRNLEL